MFPLEELIKKNKPRYTYEILSAGDLSNPILLGKVARSLKSFGLESIEYLGISQCGDKPWSAHGSCHVVKFTIRHPMATEDLKYHLLNTLLWNKYTIEVNLVDGSKRRPMSKSEALETQKKDFDTALAGHSSDPFNPKNYQETLSADNVDSFLPVTSVTTEDDDETYTIIISDDTDGGQIISLRPSSVEYMKTKFVTESSLKSWLSSGEILINENSNDQSIRYKLTNKPNIKWYSVVVTDSNTGMEFPLVIGVDPDLSEEKKQEDIEETAKKIILQRTGKPEMNLLVTMEEI